jgi:AraC-like DNA-binding protein
MERQNMEMRENAAPFYAEEGSHEGVRNKVPVSHWHDEPEWITVLRGELSFQVDEEVLRLEAGDSLLVLPGAIHKNLPHPEGTEFVRVVMNTSLFTSNEDILYGLIAPFIRNHEREYYLLRHDRKEAPAVADLLCRLEKISHEGGRGTALEIIAGIHMLMYYLVKLFPEPLEEVGRESLSDRMAQKDMVAYIRKHYMERITLSEVAEAGKVSKSKCGQLFKTYMGCTPIEFINNYRLGVSCGLLAEGKSAADAAYASGFTSQSYFTKLFARRYQMTPTAWKKSMIHT